MAKPKKSAEPTIVRPDDIDPHHNWKRPIGAPGHTQVDFEERVNFRRLHDYRLARVRAALSQSGLGALLSFDQHNIRYTTSTVIGEWARDKLTRYSLLTGNGDPYIWDFGSAAKHHRLHAPCLHHDHCRAGLLGLRGAVGGDITLFRDAASEIKSILDPEGLGNMPLGLDVVEPPMLFELQKLGIEVRDGQQTLLAAREVKNIDELVLLNMAAAMVDGVYQDIAEALKPGVKESEIVALATARLYGMGSDCVEAINAISGERCSPHPHNFTDRLIRPGDQAFFDIIQSFMGYRTCYYRTFNVGMATKSQRDADRGRSDPDADRTQGHLALSGAGLADRQPLLSSTMPPEKSNDTTASRIGWIGTGRMGYAMAERLAKGGADVTVWNRTRAKAEPLAAHGVKIADKLSELAGCGVVFCMVSTWDDVR